ncbi:MAG: hypothetical protein II312_08625 [Lachnospiraceae bacterium]|nr:hypothetical protein [Lachnospiraceae bacterium]
MYVKKIYKVIIIFFMCIAMSFSLVGMSAGEMGYSHSFADEINLNSADMAHINNDETISVMEIQVVKSVFSIMSNIKNSVKNQSVTGRLKVCFESLIAALYSAEIISLSALALFSVNRLRQKSVHLIISNFIQNKDGKKKNLTYVI